MLLSSWKLNECNLSCKIAEKLQNYRGPVIIYGPGGRRILGGITWFLGEQKGVSVVLENPKGEITENFGRIQGGGEFAWKWTYGEWGGSRKSSKVIRGDDLSDVSFKGGVG